MNYCPDEKPYHLGQECTNHCDYFYDENSCATACDYIEVKNEKNFCVSSCQGYGYKLEDDNKFCYSENNSCPYYIQYSNNQIEFECVEEC